MAIDLQVGNTTYAYPTPGEEPNWGADATSWAQAVTELLQSIAGAGTINEVESVIANNVTTDTEVLGLAFSETLTQAAIVLYRIVRDSDDITPVTEMGKLDIVYDNGTWKMSREIGAGEPAGVTLDINSLGQVVYQSTNISGANYEGVVKFKTVSVLS